MSFKRDSLAVRLDRVYASCVSLFRPFDKTPRQNLLRVFASVDAGMYHQLLGDLDFLSKQIFPDTAEGEYLREHWPGKTAPLYAVAASGEATATGKAGRTIPSGVVFGAASGERYYLEKSFTVRKKRRFRFMGKRRERRGKRGMGVLYLRRFRRGAGTDD
jgi:uncharacterized phage protein gp47/JayE